MDLNVSKCCYLSFSSNLGESNLILEESTITEGHVLSGVTIDNKLNFCNHLRQLCSKVANKLNVLT